MKRIVLMFAVLLAPVTAIGQNCQQFGTQVYCDNVAPDSRSGRLNTFPERGIEVRPRFDYDPANRYRGRIDSDGDARLRNFDGDRLRGNIDDDGYGRLRDDRGRDYRVRPR